MSPSPGSAGALLTGPFQYEIANGIGDAWLLGSGTYNQTEKVEGLLGYGSVRDRDIYRQDTHGATAQPDLLDKRKIVMTINLLFDDSTGLNRAACQQELENRINLAYRWFRPVTKDLVLAFRRPWGSAPGYKDFFCMVRPKRRLLVSDADLATGRGTLAVELHAADPRVYSLTAPAAVVINTTVGTPNGAAIVHPLGESESYPVYTITGPAQNPVIANSDDANRQISLLVTMAGGDTLVVDTFTHIITLNGTPRWDLLNTANKWHKLLPQIDNHITFNQSNGAAATHLSIAYRDTWV